MSDAGLAGIVCDLEAEQAVLDEIVAGRPEADWNRATASPVWTVRDQIGHLEFFDRQAVIAITEPARFTERRRLLVERFADRDATEAVTLSRSLPIADLVGSWRAARRELAGAAGTMSASDRVEWFGPSMGAKSFLTARLMEVWAHGQDVVDALGVERPDTDRLAHIAQLGVLTRGWSYAVRGDVPPDRPVRVELVSPSGAVWLWGPAEADDRVTGAAGDFCRVVTQRRHVDDTALVLTGSAAVEWLSVAQAFAGRPTSGPAPRVAPSADDTR